MTDSCLEQEQPVELRENILFLANQPAWVLKLIVALLHSNGRLLVGPISANGCH